MTQINLKITHPKPNDPENSKSFQVYQCHSIVTRQTTSAWSDGSAFFPFHPSRKEKGDRYDRECAQETLKVNRLTYLRYADHASSPTDPAQVGK